MPVDKLAYPPAVNNSLWVAKTFNTQDIVNERAASLRINGFIGSKRSEVSEITNHE